jgi:hypothetical protein
MIVVDMHFSANIFKVGIFGAGNRTEQVTNLTNT